MAGIFSGIGEATLSKDGNYPKPGQYLCRIDRCHIKDSRKKETFAFIEMTTVKVLDDVNGTGHRLGEEFSFAVKKTSDYFMRDIKAFLAAVDGRPVDSVPTDEWEQLAEQVFGVENPLAGFVVEVHSYPRLKKDGNPDNPKDHYTVTRFKREVPAIEVIEHLDAPSRDRFFPNNALQIRANADAQRDEIPLPFPDLASKQPMRPAA